MERRLPTSRIRRPRLRARRPRRRLAARRAGRTAKRQIDRLRIGSILAIALTAFILMLVAPDDAATQTTDVTEAAAEAQATEVDDAPADSGEAIVSSATEEAWSTVKNLKENAARWLPKVIVVLAVLLIAWIVTRLIRPLIRLVTRQWEHAAAINAISGVTIWLVALGFSVSVLAGDIRALVGSIGLVGLALSWALQTPIESFAGWLLNSFRGYYRVGDRIAVGEIFGDVQRIDVLATTVWEIGSVERGGPVRAEQPTGRLITFPNNEILTGSIVNLTRDFPWVWDEVTVSVGTESDLPWVRETLATVASAVIGDQMRQPARRYADILRSSRVEASVSEEPEIYLSFGASAIDFTIRYLVEVRQRRLWRARLVEAIQIDLQDERHVEKITAPTPQQRILVSDVSGSRE